MKIITTVKNGDDNQQDQNEIVEEMIDAGCDVLCVNLVDRTAPIPHYQDGKTRRYPSPIF